MRDDAARCGRALEPALRPPHFGPSHAVLTVLRFLLVVLACQAPWLPATAALFKDEALQRLHDQWRHDELEREGRQRGGAEGLAAQGFAALQRNGLPAAIRLGEQCAQQHPQAAVCHYLLGLALGTDAQSGGVLKAMRLVGRVKASFERAIELDAQMLEARSALQMIYLLLPRMAGGSVEKARQLEEAVHDSQPELAKLLRARLAAHDDRWDEAERELASVRLGDQVGFQTEVLNAWAGLARHWAKAKQHAKARLRFEQLAQVLPQLAQPAYLLARALADDGRYAEAVRQFERAQGLAGADQLPIDYRQGIAHMDLGERDKARLHLQRFVQADRGTPRNLEDARKRLKELG